MSTGIVEELGEVSGVGPTVVGAAAVRLLGTTAGTVGGGQEDR